MTVTTVGTEDRGNFRCRACGTKFQTITRWIAHLRESRHKQ